MTPKTTDILPQMLFFLCCIIILVLHAMSDVVVVTSNEPSTIWMLFLPVKAPSKIGSFLTSFTRHASLRSRRKKKAEWDHMLLGVRNIKSQRRTLFFLSQTSCGWLIVWCMTQIFLRFKAFSAYLYDRLPERVTQDHWSFVCGKSARSSTHVGC